MMFKSINPATNEMIAEYPSMSSSDLENILDKSQRAQQKWRNTHFDERKRLMLNLADCLLDNKQQYAQLMTDEMGKISDQGISEIEKCAWGCRYYAEQAEQFLATEDIKTDAQHSFVTYKPLGLFLPLCPGIFLSGRLCVLPHPV